MKINLDGLEKERDFYFAKLRDIEIMCQDVEGGEGLPLVQKILDVLYQTEVMSLSSFKQYHFANLLFCIAFSCPFHRTDLHRPMRFHQRKRNTKVESRSRVLCDKYGRFPQSNKCRWGCGWGWARNINIVFFKRLVDYMPHGTHIHLLSEIYFIYYTIGNRKRGANYPLKTYTNACSIHTTRLLYKFAFWAPKSLSEPTFTYSTI